MSRPVVLGVAGDSAAGKTTLIRGVVRVLGGASLVAYISGDDYHRYGRRQRAEREITPLDPAANHLDILGQDLRHLRNWEGILKPVYNHIDGTLDAPEYVAANPFVVVEGLLPFHTEELRAAHDILVFLAPPEDLRRGWKMTRDCIRRGYTTHQVLSELDMRERDADAHIKPQRKYADIVVSFTQTTSDNPELLDAHVILRNSLKHPDLAVLLRTDEGGPSLIEREAELLLRIPGDIDPSLAEEIEVAVWERAKYASHLRTQRLGEFTVGTELHRSQSLALVQSLFLYHLVSTRTMITAGVDPRVWQVSTPTGADSALHA